MVHNVMPAVTTEPAFILHCIDFIICFGIVDEDIYKKREGCQQ